MVKITGYAERTSKDGEKFIALQLQGDLVMVQSQETGRYYATAKKCSMGSTFTEEEAEALIGREMQGRIEKVATEPYEYTIEDTGEVITLSHRYEYIPEGEPTPLRVVHKEAA